MGQELGQIDIDNGSQQQGVFILLWKSELQCNKPAPKEEEEKRRRENMSTKRQTMREKKKGKEETDMYREAVELWSFMKTSVSVVSV